MGWECGGVHHYEPGVLLESQLRRGHQRRMRPRVGSEHLTSACRLFFAAWLRRSESLRGRWQREPAPLSSLDHKIRHLRSEIAELASQDTQLFRQLFALQDSIDELKGQLETSPASSSSSLASLLPESPEPTEVATPDKPKRRATLVAHTSFVRQRVSYPPSARNRCRRSQTLPPPQSRPRSSHDSHEIFV